MQKLENATGGLDARISQAHRDEVTLELGDHAPFEKSPSAADV